MMGLRLRLSENTKIEQFSCGSGSGSGSIMENNVVNCVSGPASGSATLIISLE
jgi:hypothetical protein